MTKPVADNALPVLSGATNISNEDRANLWDIFHDSKDHNELAQKLQPLAVPDDVKGGLYDAKKQSQPTGAIDSVVNALTEMAALDPKVLDLAEKHHVLAKHFIEAATKG
jgi:hypothetical protein